VIGIAGGTGSGKTTVAERLSLINDTGTVALVRLDSYYRDRSDLSFEQRVGINYDHPDAFDWPLLLDHLKLLCGGERINVPTYDFTIHQRTDQWAPLDPAPIVVVEGILVLFEPLVREVCDLKVFIDTDADVRFIRRMQRDIAERGRTAESVIDQYLSTVRPMHLQFVEPTKRYADVIVPEGGQNQAALDTLIARVMQLA
jgi:uridine kinase